MLLYLLLIVIILISIILFIKLIRYNDSRIIIFYILGLIKNINIHFEKNPIIIKKILETISNKGDFIEKMIALPAWYPIKSLESVNGEEWIEQKKLYIEFIKHIPSTKLLEEITEEITTKYIYKEIDSYKIAKIVLEIMIKWLFDLNILEDDLNIIVYASIEWKKEIAIKGQGNIKLKYKTIDIINNLINKSKYYDIFKDKWTDPLYYSIILQPFIISPMINIPDIAIYINKYETIDEAIFYHHPFPLLERYIEKDLYINNELIIKKNTQVFIPYDTIFKNIDYNKNKTLIFGSGPRKCAGINYAYGILKPLFKILKNNKNFKPEKNHKYSGRNNDNDTYIFYPLYIVIKLIINSIYD